MAVIINEVVGEVRPDGSSSGSEQPQPITQEKRERPPSEVHHELRRLEKRKARLRAD